MNFNEIILLWGILSIIIGYVMNYMVAFPHSKFGETSLTGSGLFLLAALSGLFSGVLVGGFSLFI
jgi:hypothetical protein